MATVPEMLIWHDVGPSKRNTCADSRYRSPSNGVWYDSGTSGRNSSGDSRRSSPRNGALAQYRILSQLSYTRALPSVKMNP
eukprot:6929922-Pyramimonas_sp.AAC.1